LQTLHYDNDISEGLILIRKVPIKIPIRIMHRDVERKGLSNLYFDDFQKVPERNEAQACAFQRVGLQPLVKFFHLLKYSHHVPP
jgi:hypothetical protein